MEKVIQMESTIHAAPIAPGFVRQPLSRWRAAAIHFALSLVVGLAVVALMMLIWFPAPYFEAMGGGGLLLLIVGVDVVLGPLITLIIFDTKKKSLKFDLSCVAIVQLLALAYGVSMMFMARPVYTVFNTNRFDVVIAADIDATERAKVVLLEFKSLPLYGPQVVAMEQPNDMNEARRMIESGIDTRAFSQHYRPYVASARAAGSASKSLAAVKALKPEVAKRLSAFIAEKSLDESKVGFLPLYTRNQDMTVVLDRETGVILALAPVTL